MRNAGQRRRPAHGRYRSQREALPRRIATSVVTGEGLEELGRVLPGMVFGGLVQANADTPVVTRRRHRRALERAVEELQCV